MDDTPAHRFALVPGASLVVVLIVELFHIEGIGWAATILAPPALIALALLNAIWAAVALKKGTPGVSFLPSTRINVRLHEAWRARTVEWGALALSLGVIALVLVAWAGPSRIVPTADIPFVEITVLSLTVTLLAVFARYTVMAFSTDVDAMVRSLESFSLRQQAERAKEAEKVAQNFTSNVDRLLGRIDEQSRATERSLSAVAAKLDSIAISLTEQLKFGKEAADAARQAAEAQQSLEEQRISEARARRERDSRDRLNRIQLIQPSLRFRLFAEGIVLHSLKLEILDTGPKATAVLATIWHSGGTTETRSVPTLESGKPAVIALGDVSGFDLDTQVDVVVSARDEDMNPYEFTGSFRLRRTVGFWGQTKQIAITPQTGLSAVRRPIFQVPREVT